MNQAPTQETKMSEQDYCVVCGLHPIAYGDVCSEECWAEFIEMNGDDA